MLGGSCNQCCGGLCSDTRERATITLSGLPACATQNLDARSFSEDSCSYTLFRVRNSGQCKYKTAWHSASNRWRNFTWGVANQLLLNLTEDRLYLYSERGTVIFSPPPGKSFNNFPFSSAVVPVSVYFSSGYPCSLESFSQCVVTIDDATVSYMPFACPPLTGSETTSCVPGVDTIPENTRTIAENTITDTYNFAFYNCSPCDGTHYATTIETAVRKKDCVDDEKSNCWEYSRTSTVPELNLAISFQGPDLNGYSMSVLNGTYALQWTNNAYVGTGNFFGLYFRHWSLGDVDANGNGYPQDASFGIDSELQAEQGWVIDYRIPAQVPSATGLGMVVAVTPVKATLAINRSSKTWSTTQCGERDIAYQVKVAVFRGLFSNTSDYAYWNWDLSAYGNLPCRQRVCGEMPSVTLSAVESVYVPFTGLLQYGTKGKIGSVTVNVVPA